MTDERSSPVIALAGQPNVGKSTIFNWLTGLNQHVGNWPGKTIEQKIGTFTHNGRQYTVVDLPGTYSLTANSEEERITRDYILRERPDVVVAVADAAVLERSLYLLTELIALPVPIILVLNMMDVAEHEGIQIEPKVLQAALGIPVVPMSATHGVGMDRLLSTIEATVDGRIPYTPSRPHISPEHQEVAEKLKAIVAPILPDLYPPDWVALKLLEGDGEMIALVRERLSPEQWKAVDALLYRHEDAVLDIASARYAWIERMIRAAVTRPRVGQVSFTGRLDNVLTHPLWGMLILLAVLGGVFWLTYTIGAPLQGWMGDWAQKLADLSRQQLAAAPPWLTALIADGLIGGVGLVITFLPILIIFFAVMAVLEDTGYMARIAYLTDRFMHAMGLHGKSFIPLLLGFGCNVPAVLGTRIIETKRARLLTILLAPLVPCTARMAVITVLTPLFFHSYAPLIAWGLVTMNVIVLALLGILLHRLLFHGEQASFIMELPLYHLPNLRTIGLYVWQNLLAFLQKAGSTILLVSLLVWALAYFPGGVQSESYLVAFGHALEPLGRLMGLSWQALTALLTSFVAKENTIATLGILYGSDLAAALPHSLSPASALAFLVVQMLFVPCAATVAVIRQEAGNRWALFSVALLLFISVLAGILVYQLGAVLGLG